MPQPDSDTGPFGSRPVTCSRTIASPTRAVLPLEVDPLNFASRIHVPTLMVNGRSDFQTPYQTSPLPLFRLLAVPPDRKRHALFEGGHMPSQIHDVMREILDWFDRFLGAVNTGAR